VRRVHPAVLKCLALAAAVMFLGIGALYAQASTSPVPPPHLREVTDETGRTIRLPQNLHRIVSLAPSMTETLYALGLQDRLVGDTNYCDFPSDAKNKPKVGDLLNPSIETIASLHPDVVLVVKGLNRLETVRALERLAISSYGIDSPHTVSDILSSIQRLAEVLGAVESGTALTKELEHRLADIQRHIAASPPRRVLFVVWTEPLISIGKNTFIADAIQHAGGLSVVDSSQSWPQMNLEEVVRLQPEFLVFAEAHSFNSGRGLDALADLPGWRILDAVKNRRYIMINASPGPRIVSSIEELARQLHPEAFTEESPAAEKIATEGIVCAR
jgi:iron complex transport system substrate-binding protein